jgi:hypothetical protein
MEKGAPQRRIYSFVARVAGDELCRHLIQRLLARLKSNGIK